MEQHHWIMLILALILGGVIARYWPTPFQKVGLP